MTQKQLAEQLYLSDRTISKWERGAGCPDISFAAFVAGGELHMYKLYPEWDMQLRISKRGHGMLVWYCTEHGLFYQLL